MKNITLDKMSLMTKFTTFCRNKYITFDKMSLMTKFTTFCRNEKYHINVAYDESNKGYFVVMKNIAYDKMSLKTFRIYDNSSIRLLLVLYI